MTRLDTRLGFTPRTPPPAWLTHLEPLALSALALALALVSDRADPFMLRHGFSWLALAPLLSGLRHGTKGGAISAAALGAAVAVAQHVGHPLPVAGLEAAVGWIVAGLLAGQFSDAWQRRGRDLEGIARDLRVQLDALWLDHHALEVSHERLRRRVPDMPVTLRDALAAVGRALREHAGEGALATLGPAVLRLFAEHAFVQAGSLHPVDAEGRPGPAVATLGAGETPPADPLLLGACESGEVTSVRERGDGSELLAAVPLVDIEGAVQAVVAVRDMPFASLHDGTLTLLAVIGGHLGNSLAPQQARAPEVPMWQHAEALRAAAAAGAAAAAVASAVVGAPAQLTPAPAAGRASVRDESKEGKP